MKVKFPDWFRFMEVGGPKPNDALPVSYPAGSYYVLMVQSRVNGLYRAATGANEEEMRKAQKRYCDFCNAGDIEYVHLYAPDGTLLDNPPSLLDTIRRS